MFLLDVADLVLKSCRRFTNAATLATRLDTAVFAYLKAFTLAYGSEAMKHKHNESTLLADQLRMDNCLLWCFTTERKHITANGVMVHAKSQKSFLIEKFSRMFAAQINCLKKP